MLITNEQKVTAYKNLKEKEKEFLTSEEFTDTLKNIGLKNSLLLDATGKLGDVIFLVLIGLVKTSEIEDQIKRDLNMSGQKLADLLKDINEKIFIPFRQILVEENQPVVQNIESIESTEAQVEPSRESILAEIENPTPSVQPISVAEEAPAGPTIPREITPETKDTVAHDFIGSKLSQTVSLPSQSAKVELAPKPKTYTTDPYREAIN